ncbi:hypothetical protein cypCar_00026671, partial [Cyprinus carpio]
MLNPSSNGESSHVVNYVEEYLELVESLPLDLQRCVSLMKEIDARYQEILNELDEAYEKHRQESDPVQRRRLLHCIQRSLIRTEELGDEKIQIAGQMVEMVENRSRQLEWQSELFQACRDSPESTVSVGSTPSAITTVTMTPVSASMLSVSKPSADRRRDETPTSVDKSGGKRSRRQKNGSENRENSNYGMEHNEEVGSGVPKEKKAKTSSTSSKKKK